MNGIQLNKEEIKAINDGATVILKPTVIIDEGQEYFVQEDLYGAISTNVLQLSGAKVLLSTTTNAERYPELSLDSYFVVHCFKEVAEFEKLEQENLYNISTTVKKTQDASQMQEQQSRLRFKVKNIQVKKVESMTQHDIEECGLDGNFLEDGFPYKNDECVFLVKK